MSADTRTINSDEFVDGLEYEAFPSGDENSLSSCQLDDEVPEETNETNTSAVVKYNSNELKLMMAFFLMIIMGTLNSVFNKVVVSFFDKACDSCLFAEYCTMKSDKELLTSALFRIFAILCIYKYNPQAIPFYNYPNFLNVFGMFVFTAALFVYIIPASKYGWFNNAISPEQRRRSKRPFAIMGGLDCITTTM